MKDKYMEKTNHTKNDEMKKLFREHLIDHSVKEGIKGSFIVIISLALSIYAGRNIYNFPITIMYLKMTVIICFSIYLALTFKLSHGKSKIVQTTFIVAVTIAIIFSMAFSIVISISSPEYSARATQVSMIMLIGCTLFAGSIRDRLEKILYVNLVGFIIIMIAIYGLSIVKFFDFYLVIACVILSAIFNRIYTDSLYQEFILKKELHEKLKQLKDEIQEKESLQQKLEYMASYDPLTNLYNRRQGLEILEKHFLLAKDEKIQLSICFMDIDNLKNINDLFGHMSGDRHMLVFIDLVRKNIRQTDFCIRMGGDEFLLVFPKSDRANAEMVWSRILANMQDVDKLKNHPYKMSVSHGIVSYIDGQYATHDEMIEAADNLMYKEKNLKRSLA